jgi:integrase
MDNPFIINQVSYLQWVRRQSESKSGEVSVYITVTCNGQKAQFNSFIRGSEKQWNAKKKHFNGIENEPLNAKLKLVISSLQQIELQLSATGQNVTAQSIIQAYQDRLQSKIILIDKIPPFLKVLESFLQRQKDFGNKRQTQKNHKTYKSHLIAFLKQSKKEKIKCKDFDYDLSDDFKLYMYNKKFSVNYTNRMLGLVKNVLDFAIMKKYIIHNPLMALHFKYDEKINITSLDLEQIELLQSHVFTPRLQKVVDIFLFMCGTGIDHCDYIRLTSDNCYTENGHVFMKQERQKSGSEADALLLSFATKILEKYKSVNDLPKCSLTELNREIKEAAKIVGIYIRLTSKIARKSYANHLCNVSGFSDETSAHFMGHTTTKHLKHYRKTKKGRVFGELLKIDNNLL